MSNTWQWLTGNCPRLAFLAAAALLLAGLPLSAARAAGAAPAAAMAPGMTMSGPTAPDFPPGSFSDFGHYNLDDFHGKLLVLFFYEKDCPTCRGLIPTRNAVVDQFKDKPVQFIAVGPNDSMNDVISYMKGTHLEMTTFADTLGVMEARYGFHISLQNIYQFRYIGPNGNVIDAGDFTADKVAQALQSVKWKYKDGGYDPRLNNAINLLEWNQYAAGMQQLRPWLKNKTAAESAKKLYDVVKEEGKQWLDQADQLKSTEPAAAYDLYTRVSTAFVGDDLAKTADEAIKTLKDDQAVKDELAARMMYAPLYNVMTRAKPTNRAEVARYCIGISTKYPTTPTGKKAAQLAQDLQSAEKLGAGEEVIARLDVVLLDLKDQHCDVVMGEVAVFHRFKQAAADLTDGLAVASSAGIDASLISLSCDGGKGGDIYYLSVCSADKLTRVAIADVVGLDVFVFDASPNLGAFQLMEHSNLVV